MAGEEHGPFTLQEAVMWLLGAAVAVIGALTRWVALDTIKRIGLVEAASMERDAKMRADFDTHLRTADEGYQRLASIETMVKTMSEDRKGAADRIEAALVRLHERVDKIIEKP